MGMLGVVDPQSLFNIVVAVAAFAGGWVLKLIYDRIVDLQDVDTRLKQGMDDIKDHYARRDDVRSMIDDVKRMLIRIEDKLDRKVDK